MKILTLCKFSFTFALAFILLSGCSQNSQNEVVQLPNQNELPDGPVSTSMEDDETIDDKTIDDKTTDDKTIDDKKKAKKSRDKRSKTEQPKKIKVVEIKNNTVKTAEEYLYAFDHNTAGFGLYKFELPDEEIDKVVKELRRRYGFESLRERLSYEDQGNRKPNPKLTELERKKMHLNFRRDSLMKLHSDEVKAFVSRPMNGFSRVIRPSPGMLRFPDPPPMTPDRFTFHPGAPELKDKVTKHLHQSFESNFAGYGSSTAYVKSIDEVAGFVPHAISMNLTNIKSPKFIPFNVPDKDYMNTIRKEKEKGDVAWKLNQFQLVSLLKHKEPRVYISENLPGMEELAEDDIETRKLNEFEKFALKRILDGEEVVVKEHVKKIEMMGSIRAQKNCLECHSVNEGSLLGTFTYEFRVIKGLDKEFKKADDDQKGT